MGAQPFNGSISCFFPAAPFFLEWTKAPKKMCLDGKVSSIPSKQEMTEKEYFEICQLVKQTFKRVQGQDSPQLMKPASAWYYCFVDGQ